MNFDAYEVYCDWLRERRMSVPTRAWWERACAKPQLATYSEVERQLRLDQAEIDRERREGWAYD